RATAKHANKVIFEIPSWSPGPEPPRPHSERSYGAIGADPKPPRAPAPCAQEGEPMSSPWRAGLFSMVIAVPSAVACGHSQTPTAVSSPVPSAAPAPTPTPAPTPSLAGFASCSKLPAVTHDVGNCPLEDPSFLPQVQTAINQVRSQKP